MLAVIAKHSKIRRKANTIGILKLDEIAYVATYFCSLTLLCHINKLLGRLMFNPLIPVVDAFRSERFSSGHALKLTQLIEKEFIEGPMTGTAIVESSAVYDSVNHRSILRELFHISEIPSLTRFIQTKLSNHQFLSHFMIAEADRENKRMGCGKDVPPLPFSIVATNSQLVTKITQRVLFAPQTQDCTYTFQYLCIAAQHKTLRMSSKSLRKHRISSSRICITRTTSQRVTRRKHKPACSIHANLCKPTNEDYLQ